jgi:hypothetical protein
MPQTVKKMFGALAICVFVVLWIFLAVAISGFVPKNIIAETVFYIVMGLGWAFPLMPVLKWMEKK